MKFFWKKNLIIIGFCILSTLFCQQIFSQEEGFGIIEITFHTGVDSPEITHLQSTIDISGGNFTGFRVQIKNTSKDPVNLKIDFGTQINTNDSENILGCQLGNNSKNTFSQNMLFDKGDFQINAYSEVYKYIQTNYNSCTSGASLGCIAVQQAQNNGIGVFDIDLSRVGFLDFDIISDSLNCNSINIKVLQEKRNLFPSAGKILPNQKTEGIIGLYNTDGSFVVSGSIKVGPGGSGETNINKALSGYYFAVFQGLSSTKSMISGILVNPDNKTLDFTTGQNIFGTVIEDRNEDGISDDGFLYQRVGEIDPYDGEINGDDIAKLLPYINKTNHEFGSNKYDIDADGGITIADIGIIIYNLHKWSIGNEYSDTGLLPRIQP